MKPKRRNRRKEVEAAFEHFKVVLCPELQAIKQECLDDLAAHGITDPKERSIGAWWAMTCGFQEPPDMLWSAAEMIFEKSRAELREIIGRIERAIPEWFLLRQPEGMN